MFWICCNGYRVYDYKVKSGSPAECSQNTRILNLTTYLTQSVDGMQICCYCHSNELNHSAQISDEKRAAVSYAKPI